MAPKKKKVQPPRQHKEPFSAFAFIHDQSTLNFIRPLRNGDYDSRGNEKMTTRVSKDEGKERASDKASIKQLPAAIIALIDKLEQLEDRAFEERT